MDAHQTFAERTPCCNGNAEVSIPIPPRDAEQFQTGCKYCIVACGYRVYKWPTGRNGGASPSQNAFGINLSQPNTAQWISPSMFNVIEEHGRRYNVAIIPDNNCVVNSGLNSVRGGTMGLTVYRADGPASNRLKHPLVWSHGQQEASWDDAVEIVARVTHQLLSKDGPDSIGVKFSITAAKAVGMSSRGRRANFSIKA